MLSACTSFVRLTPSLKKAFNCSFARCWLLVWISCLSQQVRFTVHPVDHGPNSEKKGFFIQIKLVCISSRSVSVHRLTLFCFSERHWDGLIYWFTHAQKNHSCLSVRRSGIGFHYAYRHLNTHTHIYTLLRVKAYNAHTHLSRNKSYFRPLFHPVKI